MQIHKIIVGYPERAFLSIVLIITVLLVIIVPEKVIPLPDNDVQTVNQKLQQIGKLLQENPLPKFPELNQSVRIKERWEKLAPPSELNNWTMYCPSMYVVEFKEPPKPEPKEIRPPIIKEMSVNPDQPDRIVIKWEKDTSAYPKPLATISGYRIYRRAKEDKESRPLSVITSAGPIYTYTDTQDIQSEMEYQYSITSFTDEKPEEMKDSKTESSPVNSQWIITPDTVKLEAREINPADNWVYIKIEKYIEGKWKSTLDFFKKGDRIGKDKFITDYEIKDIKEEERRKMIDPADPKRVILLKVYKITLRNVKTGKEKVIETKPVPK